jgi:hypothetical protein
MLPLQASTSQPTIRPKPSRLSGRHNDERWGGVRTAYFPNRTYNVTQEILSQVGDRTATYYRFLRFRLCNTEKQNIRWSEYPVLPVGNGPFKSIRAEAGLEEASIEPKPLALRNVLLTESLK